MLTDPIQWEFHPENPVIRPGQLHPELDARVSGAASVIQLGDRYQMFYWGSGRSPNCLCAAESTVESPNDWRPLGCIVAPDPSDQWNVDGPRWPWALVIDERTVFLYFCSRSDPKERPYPSHYRLLISEDGGESWRSVSDRPLFERQKPYEQEAFGSVCVVKVGAKFHMYYTAIKGYIPRPPGIETNDTPPLPLIGIGLATSDDGICWERPYDHYLIGPRLFATEPYEYKVAKPCVIRDGDIWRMWVSCFGRHYRVHSLLSSDAIHWHWQPACPNGEMGIGAPGSFDDHQRCYAMVVKHEEQYRCWYTGNGFGATGMGYAIGTLGPAD